MFRDWRLDFATKTWKKIKFNKFWEIWEIKTFFWHLGKKEFQYNFDIWEIKTFFLVSGKKRLSSGKKRLNLLEFIT